MPGVKTNEREGTRAVLRHSRLSASKVRQVLDLIRGQDVDRAGEILSLGDREAAADKATCHHEDRAARERAVEIRVCDGVVFE